MKKKKKKLFETFQFTEKVDQSGILFLLYGGWETEKRMIHHSFELQRTSLITKSLLLKKKNLII
jgi:hypothetical protein